MHLQASRTMKPIKGTTENIMQYDRQSLLSIQWLCLVMHFCSQHSASQVPPSRTTIDVILFYVRSRARNLW